MEYTTKIWLKMETGGESGGYTGNRLLEHPDLEIVSNRRPAETEDWFRVPNAKIFGGTTQDLTILKTNIIMVIVDPPLNPPPIDPESETET